MSELQELNTLNDLLNTNMSDVDTSFPVLKAGVKRFIISEFVGEDNKEHTGKVLRMVLKTVYADTTERGKEVAPGFPLTHRIGLTETEKYTMEMIKKNIASLKEAVFGDKESHTNEDFIGREVNASVKIDVSDDYGRQNKISRFVVAKKV